MRYIVDSLVPWPHSYTALNKRYENWGWVIWIAFMIITQVAYHMGYYTGALNYSGCCRVWAGAGAKMSPPYGPPL
ncbi:hypothetical protein KEJ27_00575 [Candidatus Bathyarchaeota archaeon]|nr:hypothetical protein [Candidatus Bathyarchaeota archaeon]MBS7614080.1 hypothetical protein [Candidatus Bathyarchaeota archaeon]MBS7617007.1 hypothetical protein [Candidatus Bathyarchaeota archaeon]